MLVVKFWRLKEDTPEREMISRGMPQRKTPQKGWHAQERGMPQNGGIPSRGDSQKKWVFTEKGLAQKGNAPTRGGITQKSNPQKQEYAQDHSKHNLNQSKNM